MRRCQAPRSQIFRFSRPVFACAVRALKRTAVAAVVCDLFAILSVTTPPFSASARSERPAQRASSPANAASIRALVDSRQRDVQACYELALSQAGEARGRVLLKWNVDAAGEAQDIAVDAAGSTLTDPALHQCIAEKIKSWKFPAARKGKLVPASHSFAFSK